MTYRANHLLTRDENILAMVNSFAQFPFLPGEFTISAPVAVTPNTGNGNSNTQATITSTPSARLQGSADIFWNRVSLNANVAGLSSTSGTLRVGNGWTVEQVKDAICKKYKLIKEEVNWTSTPTPPTAEQTVTYSLTNAASTSYFFNDGSLSIQVTNVMGVEEVGPEYFFSTGEISGGYNGLRAFTLPAAAYNLYTSYKFDAIQTFINLMNRSNSKLTTVPFKRTMFTFDEPAAVVNGSSNTMIKATPTAECMLVDPIYFAYTRLAWSTANFNTSAGNLDVRLKKDIDLFHAWMKVINGIPYNEVRYVSSTGSVGSARTLVVSNDHVTQPMVYLPAVGNKSISIPY